MASEKQQTAKQHFVPQFYLRNFADEQGLLHIFDTKNRRRTKPRAASGVCYDQFFYAVETGKPDEVAQGVEEFFSVHVEDPLSKDLPDILAKLSGTESVTDTEKYVLSLFMNTMWLRNPAMRRQINNMQEQMTRQITKLRFGHPSSDKLLDRVQEETGQEFSAEERQSLRDMVFNDEYDLEFSNKMHLGFMLDAEHLRGFANLFFGQYWTVHVSKCERQFVTSDNPVVVVLPPRDHIYGPTFLERTHIFPLTPNLAIEATYPHTDSGKKLKRKTHFPGSEYEVDRINLLIAGRSNFVYASRNDEIQWFENFAEAMTPYYDRSREG